MGLWTTVYRTLPISSTTVFLKQVICKLEISTSNTVGTPSMTQGLFSHWTELILISSQAFARSCTLAFSSVTENVHLNTKLELCWKMLLFIKLFHLILFLFYLILFDIIVVIVILWCYNWFIVGNEPAVINVNLLNFV